MGFSDKSRGLGGLTDVPPDVRRFIASNIDSVGQLEALLLLRGERDRIWGLEEVSRALYTPSDSAAMHLELLCERELIRRVENERDSTFTYDPATPELDRVIGRVAGLYASYRHAVVGLIASTPSDQVQSFADAFKFRRDE